MKALALFVLLFTLPSLAGATSRVVGNGGRGVVCKSGNRITSVQVLDLYEAKLVYRLTLKDYSGALFFDILDDINAKLAGVWSVDPKLIADHVFKRRSAFNILPTGVKLEKIDDSNEAIIPAHCTIEQLAIFKSESLILVDGDYWAAMDNWNKAALLYHEVIYETFRNDGAVESTAARKIVGYLFSQQALEPIGIQDPRLKQQAVSCVEESHKFAFDVYPSCQRPDCKAIFQFDKLNGQPVFSKTTVITDLNFEWFIQGNSNTSAGGQDSGKVESVISDGLTLWWYYNTPTVAPPREVPPYIDLQVQVNTGGSPIKSNYVTMRCYPPN